ncbi:MAG TPA: protein-methionine-sulfoxide reductase heme-binding subunit MsrQ [Azospirillaceae bacterium]|nr:protein-methionine-sulfoxide reductase heme-binding subunit MsrQ [Azospirillaceae bacterium]
MRTARADPQKQRGKGWRPPTWMLYLAGAAPGVWLFWQGVNDRLGADPLKELEHGLGEWSLRFLILGLAVTPLRQAAGVNLVKYRRALGLLAFFYALAHLLTYVVLDQGLDWRAVWGDIVKRPYITVGMAAFLILLPLAATSSNAAMRRLGRRWGQLHRWVYPAALLAALHFLILVKSWPAEPIIYTALVIALLVWRAARRWLPRRALA